MTIEDLNNEEINKQSKPDMTIRNVKKIRVKPSGRIIRVNYSVYRTHSVTEQRVYWDVPLESGFDLNSIEDGNDYEIYCKKVKVNGQVRYDWVKAVPLTGDDYKTDPIDYDTDK